MALNQNLKNQIREAWSRIDVAIDFVLIHNGTDSKLSAFREFFSEVAQLNDHISLQEQIVENESIRLELKVAQGKVGIAFQGIPLGHELTSFVLAPLAAIGKAQMPDQTTQARVKALKGDLNIVSYVSLSCENCPIVVQAFNMMAALNEHIQHTMVDGSLYPDLMKDMGILSVPTVQLNGTTFVTGRQSMSELLEKLEATMGVEEASMLQETKHYDVVVVGGGPAGTSAAIYTARKGLKTAIVTENVGGLVRETKGIENLISTPYIEGPQLAHGLQKHLSQYPVDIYENQSVKGMAVGKQKALQLKGGLELQAKVVIAATGAKWKELNVAGEKEYLGRGVAFCPHCDGPFYKEKDIAVVGGGNSGIEAALDLAGICKKVTVLEFGAMIKADKVLVDKLSATPNISVITDAQTLEIVGDGKTVTRLVYLNRKNHQQESLELAGVFIQIGLVPNSTWIAGHVETTKYGEIVINEKTATSAAGIFAAGDVSTVPYKQIVIAMGEGAKAGLSAFEYLLKAP